MYLTSKMLKSIIIFVRRERNGGKLTIDRMSGSADCEETVKLKNFLTLSKQSAKIVNVRRG